MVDPQFGVDVIELVEKRNREIEAFLKEATQYQEQQQGTRSKDQ